MIERSIQANWPAPEAPLAAHRMALKSGITALREALVLPEDGRFEIAYAHMATGQDRLNSYLAIGPNRTGKTTYGEILGGHDSRIDIKSQDTDDKLYGARNPIDPSGDINPGKLSAISPRIRFGFINEVSHLADTGVFHDLYDGNSAVINAQRRSTVDLVALFTSNWPDGTDPRVKPIGMGLRHRLAGELLAGDHDDEKAAEIQGAMAVKNRDDSLWPIMPPADHRRAMHNGIVEMYPVDGGSRNATGRYLVSLIRRMNESGIIHPLSTTDASLGLTLHDMARSRLFLQGAEEGTSITPQHLASLAALSIPKVVQLSHTAKGQLREEIGTRSASAVEQAIAIRRFVAATAFQVYAEDGLLLSDSETKKFVDRAVARYSYANPDYLTFDVDRALARTSEVSGSHNQEPRRERRILPRRRAK